MCTTMAIGKDATRNGSVIIAHSDDDVSDERFMRVPATANNAPGTMRPVYYDNAALGPMIDPKSGKNYNASDLYRYIGTSRGPAYVIDEETMRKEGLYNSIAIGSIPQVPNTYSYFDFSYGVMNEHRLMIGECTCGAKVHPTPSPKRLFYSGELSRIAMERCTRAREAVELMGSLILQYGYHGTGETLLVGDTEEAWVMEMCGYDPDGTDGLWVAQRVPDNGFFVAANQFRIRDIDTDSPDMLYSKNLHEVCQRLGWWSPEESPLLDWAATVSFGEYSHPYYSLRRVWRALVKAKPSADLSPWVEGPYTKAYPFSVVPDVKLDVAGVAAIYRDNYEGTEFDQTKGTAAGPWGDPTRYENNPDKGNSWQLSVNVPQGAWERPISIFRCGLFWINEASAALGNSPANGVSWIGLDRPATSCLLPFFCQATELPKSIQTMNVTDFDLESAWWTFNFVANYVTLKYCYMINDLQSVRDKLEGDAFNRVKEFGDSGEHNIEELTRYCSLNAEKVRKSWWDLAKNLIVTYNDGCRTSKGEIMQKIDYPSAWLTQTDYYQGPTSYKKES